MKEASSRVAVTCTKKVRNSGKMCKQYCSAEKIYPISKTRIITCAKTTMIKKKIRYNNFLRDKYRGLFIGRQIIIKNSIRFFLPSSFA